MSLKKIKASNVKPNPKKERRKALLLEWRKEEIKRAKRSQLLEDLHMLDDLGLLPYQQGAKPTEEKADEKNNA